jgi:hypothetical protein
VYAGERSQAGVAHPSRKRLKHGAGGAEPKVHHRSVASCGKCESEGVSDPPPTSGTQLHVSRCRAQD